MDKEHREQVAKLHEEYRRYKRGLQSVNREPLDYDEWLEHTAIRLADCLGEMAEHVETLEDERDRFARAAQTNHDCWQEATRLSVKLYGMLEAVKVAALRGDIVEVGRLVLHWECWN